MEKIFKSFSQTINENSDRMKDMWLVDFEGGGWNTVKAKNLKDAIKAADKEFGKYNPIHSKIRPLTKTEYDMYLTMSA